MKPNLAILLLLLPLTAGLNAKDNDQDHSEVKERNEAPTPYSTLADQLKDIASSPTMTHKSQAKLVSSAVRLAVSTVTKGVNDPAKILKIAMDLAAAAGRAAPQFADEICDAIDGSPAVTHIPGLANLIKDAVQHGQDQADDTDTAHPERNEHKKHGDDHDFGGHCDDPKVSPSH